MRRIWFESGPGDPRRLVGLDLDREKRSITIDDRVEPGEFQTLLSALARGLGMQPIKKPLWEYVKESKSFSVIGIFDPLCGLQEEQRLRLANLQIL